MYENSLFLKSSNISAVRKQSYELLGNCSVSKHKRMNISKLLRTLITGTAKQREITDRSIMQNADWLKINFRLQRQLKPTVLQQSLLKISLLKERLYRHQDSWPRRYRKIFWNSKRIVSRQCDSGSITSAKSVTIYKVLVVKLGSNQIDMEVKSKLDVEDDNVPREYAIKNVLDCH